MRALARLYRLAYCALLGHEWTLDWRAETARDCTRCGRQEMLLGGDWVGWRFAPRPRPAPWSQRFRRCKEFARKRRKHSKWRQFFVALWASRLKEMGAAVDEISGRLP